MQSDVSTLVLRDERLIEADPLGELGLREPWRMRSSLSRRPMCFSSVVVVCMRLGTLGPPASPPGGF